MGVTNRFHRPRDMVRATTDRFSTGVERRLRSAVSPLDQNA